MARIKEYLVDGPLSSLNGEPGMSWSRINSTSVMASRVKTEMSTRLRTYFFNSLSSSFLNKRTF
jgi:hypothetical protein